MVVIHATRYKTIPMTDVFGTFLPNIYLFLKTKVWQFEISFSRISRVDE
jgi:hypothetical protein